MKGGGREQNCDEREKSSKVGKCLNQCNVETPAVEKSKKKIRGANKWLCVLYMKSKPND